MAGLDDVVEVFHLPVPRVLRAFALGLELCNGGAAGRRPVGVQHLGQFPLLALPQGLAEGSLRRFGVAGRREVEVERAVQIRPLAADPDAGLVNTPAPRPGAAPLPAQALLNLRGVSLRPAVDCRAVDRATPRSVIIVSRLR